MEREYKIEYQNRHSESRSRVAIWKEKPEGLKNVWIRKKKSNWSGTRVVIGYTQEIDGVLTSGTKPVSSGVKYVRNIRLVTFLK